MIQAEQYQFEQGEWPLLAASDPWTAKLARGRYWPKPAGQQPGMMQDESKLHEGRPLWRMTLVTKWFLPIAAIAVLIVATVIGLSSESPSPAIAIFPAMALSIVGLAAGSVWSFVDEVVYCSDGLVFRKGRVRQTVRFEDISNISAESKAIPKKISVVTRTGGPLGKVLVFGAPEWFSHGEPPAILSELLDRVESSKSS